MWSVRVYRPAFVHQLKRHFGRVQKDEALADNVEVGDATSPPKKKISTGLPRGGLDAPYCFAHRSAWSQSSFEVRSATLPRTGSGFGPGGNGAGGFGRVNRR